jgi:UDP-N-acetylglucosamine 1-carboxyvinyltransferase
MGATIEIKNGYVVADAPKGLNGAHIIFSKASVGATCNILMAATLAKGITKIENAAKEPEITDLIDLLNSMGAKIFGRGTSILTIEGVDKLHGAEHAILADRIEAGSYAIAAAITKGKIELINAKSEHLQQPLRVLEKMGVSIKESDNSIIVDARNRTITGEDIYTDYYPGFPTDLQAQYMALMTVAEGASMVTESIWENRFMHVPELCRMGANINIHGHASAIVRGVKKLSGAQVMATDLRASFALILAGLIAEGVTEIDNCDVILRGYGNLVKKLSSVGAKLEITE